MHVARAGQPRLNRDLSGLLLHVASHVVVIYAIILSVPFLEFVLPFPHRILVSLVERDLASGRHNGLWILENLGVTLFDALSGFLIGNGVAMLLAITMLFLPRTRDVILRDAIALKSIPWIVLIPILMLSPLGPTWKTRVALVSLACFFPTLINFSTGLHEVDQDVLDYTATLPGITEWATFRYVRLNYSLPYLFASFKTAASIVILSAVVVEWLVSGAGLGWMLYLFNYRYRMDLLYAVAGIAGLTSYGLLFVVTLAEQKITS